MNPLQFCGLDDWGSLPRIFLLDNNYRGRFPERERGSLLRSERGCVLVVVGGELAVTVVILDSFDTYCQLLNPIVIFLSHSLLNYPCLLQSLTRQQLEIDFKPPYHRREVDRCVETTDEDEGKLWREGIQESCECCLNQVCDSLQHVPAAEGWQK